MTCGTCDGSGDCPNCNGGGYDEFEDHECDECEGTGDCYICDGTGIEGE